MAVEISPACPADEVEWRQLWQGYCDFYQANVSPQQTSLTWSRILDTGHALNCFIARNKGGNAIGFVTCLTHPSSWLDVGDCYLEDLFVSETARGAGAGRGLIAAVQGFAVQSGCERLYWMTNAGNDTARKLYDNLAGPEDGHVRYRMKLHD